MREEEEEKGGVGERRRMREEEEYEREGGGEDGSEGGEAVMGLVEVVLGERLSLKAKSTDDGQQRRGSLGEGRGDDRLRAREVGVEVEPRRRGRCPRR